MPYIKPNSFYTAQKVIKPYECSMLVIEGPNLKGKLNLEGLELKYENFNLSQLILNPESTDQPLLYGFLGNNITFLMVRAKYIPVDPMWAVETEQYIDFYYGDEPTQIRSMGELLLLTGNSVKRIPQIYFNNPSTKNKVYLEVLMANLEQESLVNPNQYKQQSYFNNLYYNSLISDIIYYTTPTSTGSTELRIIDGDGNSLIYIPYSNIRTIQKADAYTLMMGLDTEEKVKLSFLSEFNTDQANSRLNWVLKSQRYRTMTINDPEIDIIPPVYTWNNVLSGSTTGITSGVTTVYLLPSGTTYTSTNIIDIMISGITDNRDGNMSIYDTNIEMFILNDIVPVTGITDVGTYYIKFEIKDLAGNINTIYKYISIYTINGDSVISSGFWDDSGVWDDYTVWVD
jgi:hypothetical protein